MGETMSDPGNGTGIALQYVREELAGLRSSVDAALNGVRSDLANLAGELRGYVNEHGPALAVMTHRLAEAEKDIATIRAEKAATEEQARRDRTALRVAVAVAVLSGLLSWLLPLITK